MVHKVALLENSIKTEWPDFPGGLLVNNSPSSAEYVGLIPGWGAKISHATGQLSPRSAPRSPHATMREPLPHATTGERLCAATKTQHGQSKY